MPKLAIPLTDEQIIALAPKERRYKIGDGQKLCLQIEPTGKKLWRMYYKRFGKETSISFGPYPEISLTDARRLRDNAHRLITEGIDPVEFKREQTRQERATRPRRPTFHLSMNADGGMTIKTKSNGMKLAVEQVAALRAFLLATSSDGGA